MSDTEHPSRETRAERGAQAPVLADRRLALPVEIRARVACSFNFEAAHWSPEWPEGHPNRRMHGHSYIAEIVAEGLIQNDYGGTVVMAERLESIAAVLKPMLDHRVLNDVDGLLFPTMEHLAHWILARARLNLSITTRVRVSRPSIGQWAEAW